MAEPETPTTEPEFHAEEPPEAPARIEVEGAVDDAVHELEHAGPELVFPEPEPRKPRFQLKLPHLRLPHIRIHLNMAIVRMALVIVVLLAFLAGLLAAIWFFAVPLFFKMVLHRAPPTFAVHTPAPGPPKPTPSPVPTLMPLPPEAPHVSDGLDPRVIGPFAFRLAGVNKLAQEKIGATKTVNGKPVPNLLVAEAEFHDSDAGGRYFTAIVTSCKDLLELWPIKGGKLREVQQKFHLDEFDKFAFVERYSEGQWGLSTCDGSM
jgi:hypothetical protein